MAAALIVAERTGRAIRRPAVETMISYTGRHMGSGWAFGLNEAMDQGGATVGSLVVALVLYLKGQCHSNKCKGWKHLKGEALLLSAFVSLHAIFYRKGIIAPLSSDSSYLNGIALFEGGCRRSDRGE
jgi:hypothetical protein